jgi:hypothetical protein
MVIGLIVKLLYVFVYKQKEYSDVHLLIFYVLSMVCCIARILNLIYVYRWYNYEAGVIHGFIDEF